jgi:AcrR family transcriptional regulator
LRLFTERGFDGVTVAEIANEANVSVATLFNYFPTKENLFYSGMEAFEAKLITAIREREPGESVLAAFGSFVLDVGGLLASKDPEATERLAAVARFVIASPALLAREREISAQSTQTLAALIAEETGADDLSPAVAANALMGVPGDARPGPQRPPHGHTQRASRPRHPLRCRAGAAAARAWARRLRDQRR